MNETEREHVTCCVILTRKLQEKSLNWGHKRRSICTESIRYNCARDSVSSWPWVKMCAHNHLEFQQIHH